MKMLRVVTVALFRLAAAAILALILVAGFSPLGPQQASAQGTVNFDIDPDITGNSANTLGIVESCAQVNVDPANMYDGVADVIIDIVVWGATYAPVGYDVSLNYEPWSVQIVPPDTDCLIKTPGAVDFGETLPDDDGTFACGAFYWTGGPGIPGDGTIVRIGLDILHDGMTILTLEEPIVYMSGSSQIPTYHPLTTDSAYLAINNNCPLSDADGDGIYDLADNCPEDQNPNQENGDEDAWGDACDNCPATATPWYVPLGDDDCDGFTTAAEDYVGTDSLDACPDGPSDDAWPLDVDMSGDVSVTGDIYNYVGRIGAVGGPPDCPGPASGDWWQRLDLDMSCDLSVTGDVYMYADRIADTCTNP